MPSSNPAVPRTVPIIKGSSVTYGSRTVSSETIDQAFSMEIGKLRKRAGLLTVSQAALNETELTLGAAAAKAALSNSGVPRESLDWILVTSETYRAFPSLAAELHSSLNLKDSCGAMDVGGACLGILQSLAVAQAFLKSGAAETILVVSADLHSRTLVPGKVRGEFGGLFGDGASAFVLQSAAQGDHRSFYGLCDLFFGCASQYAHAIQLRDLPVGGLDVVFDGEALSRAAINKMVQVIEEVETRSGFSREDAFGFATHQPNPRLVALLAKQAGVPAYLFPPIVEVHGNLGASTCGAALHELLCPAGRSEIATRKPIFLASLGPGLLFGGGWLVP